MTLESQDTTTSNASESSDLSSLIPVYSGDDAGSEKTTEVTAQAEQPQAEPQTNELEELKQQNERLRRMVAMNPQSLSEYAQQNYGSQPQAVQQFTQPSQVPAPAPQPEAPQNISEAFAAAFPDEEYNPYNISHSAFVQNFNLKPALSYIEQLQKQEAQEQERAIQQQAEQRLDSLALSVEDIFVQKMPFFKEILEAGDKGTAKQKFVADQTRTLFQQTLSQMFPANQMVNGHPFNPLWVMPEAYHEVVSAIAPEVGRLAADMGLNLPKPQVNPDMARDAYVESPNAIPTPTNDFAAAIQNYDLTAMVGAIPIKPSK